MNPQRVSRKSLLTASAGALIAAVMVGYFWRVTTTHPNAFVPGYRVTDHVTALIGAGDSQATLTLAEHGVLPPSATNPSETGYRWRRPLPVVLTYIAGLGQKRWMGYGMMVISLLGVGLLVYVVADWLGDRGHWAILLVFFPGIIASVQWFSMDPLGLALGIIGWRRRNPWLLAAAGLFHETFLIFAIHRHKVSPIAIYALWALITYGVWGWGVPSGTLAFLKVATLQNPTLSIVAFFIGAALGFIALREDFWLAVLFLALMFVLGPIAWWRWQDSTRILLPLWVLGFVSFAQFHLRHRGRPSVDVAEVDSVAVSP